MSDTPMTVDDLLKRLNENGGICYKEHADMIRAFLARPEGATSTDTALLDAFEKVDGTVYYTTTDWRGNKQSGWSYWEMFGPEGPELYPTARAAMRACVDDPDTDRPAMNNGEGPKLAPQTTRFSSRYTREPTRRRNAATRA